MYGRFNKLNDNFGCVHKNLQTYTIFNLEGAMSVESWVHSSVLDLNTLVFSHPDFSKDCLQGEACRQKPGNKATVSLY